VKNLRDGGTLDSKHKELMAKAEHLEIRSKVPLVLAELLFDQNIHAQVRRHRLLFLRFTHDDLKAQKYLMGGLEQVIALHKKDLMPRVPHLLKVRLNRTKYIIICGWLLKYLSIVGIINI
jgi:translation initiation factor 5